MEIKPEEKNLSSKKGQILPGVVITGAILAVFGFAMLRLFTGENKLMVRSMDIMRKQELANTALEHARYKIQTGSYWYQLPLAGFLYDKEYTLSGLGSYSIYIAEGNLFMNSSGVRQGASTYRTIGVKLKIYPSNDVKMFYGVVKKVGYGGPLISKGKINLPCTQDAAANNRYNFLWGDVYSANPADDACRIPVVPVGRGSASPQEWGTSVYAAGNIYTAVGKTGSNFIFGYTYDDMSPTARCHPYSSFAKAPPLALNTYKQLAKEQGGYYGPSQMGGVGANPYYIDSDHELNDLTAAKIAAHLNDTERVLFIDTTDALPVRMPGNVNTPTNTYCGTTYTSTNTLAVYQNCAYQYYTLGSLLVCGPFTMKGDNPGTPANNCGNLADQTKNPFSSGWPCKYVDAPDNYYFPQSDAGHYDVDGKGNQLNNIKHAGFLYVDGELRIGGPRCGTPSFCQNPGTVNCAMPSQAPAPAKETAKAAVKTAAEAVVGLLFNPGVAYAGQPPTNTPKKTDTPVPTNTPGGPTSTPTPVPSNTPTAGPTSGPTITNCPTNSTTATDVAVYGTIYIDEHGSLTVDTANDPQAEFHFYYNENGNAFGFLQQNVIVTSFKEMTYLVPTPMPVYPF